MRAVTAQTKNILNAYDAFATILSAASEGIPAMGMFTGKAGLGKTTAGAWLFCQADGILVRCLKADTLGTFLERLATDLGLDRRQRQADMIDFIVKELALAGKPLFIDEADYLADKFNILETIRDIYDLANVPIILIGYEELPRKLKRLPQLHSRISQHVEFKPADFEDTKEMATQLLERCALEDDLLKQIQTDEKGNFRRITTTLSHIEKFCHVNNLATLNASQWAAR
jgi:DNA transposition AAA+ family ATPase